MVLRPNLGIAVQNPYLTTNSPKLVNLWDSDPLTACCTTPIGYHPSAYGAYLDALTLFYKITGMDPVLMEAEFNPNNPLFAYGLATGKAAWTSPGFLPLQAEPVVGKKAMFLTAATDADAC